MCRACRSYADPLPPVTGALFIKEIRQLETGASPDGNSIALHALLFYGFTLGLNVLCTGMLSPYVYPTETAKLISRSVLISLRLFIQQRQTADAKISSVNLQNTMIIVIESGTHSSNQRFFVILV